MSELQELDMIYLFQILKGPFYGHDYLAICNQNAFKPSDNPLLLNLFS